MKIPLDLLILLKTVAVWGRSPEKDELDEAMRSASKSFNRSNSTLVDT